MRETLEAERVIAWLYDAPAQTVTPYGADSPGEPSLLGAWAETPIDRLPFACTALLESQAVEIENAQDDERVPAELAAELGIASIRFEPLLAGRPVGLVSIEPASAAASAELHSMLPLVAAGVARVATRNESDRGRREADFLLGLTHDVSGARSIDQMLAGICERVASETGARRATIFLLEANRLVARSSRERDGSYDRDAWLRLRAEAPPPLVEAALQSGRAAVASEPASPLLSESWIRSLDVGSALAVPLGTVEHPIGVLVLDDPAADCFSPDAIRLAEAVARHVSAGVEQALVNDERSSHLRAATVIRRLLEEGSSAISVREAGEVLARVTRDALGAERATLLLQDENDEIEHVISVGADGEFARVLQERIGSAPARDFRIWRLTTRQPKPIFVENARASRLIPPEVVEELDLQSYVAVPLLSASRPLGIVLCSHSSAPRSWTPDERQLVMQIALEGSLVVENAVLRAVEHEWLERLSQQAFHDSLTNLPNRALFADRLQHALDRMTRRRESIAVLFLDLDEFKPINDTFGHDAGDRLLVAVGERLQSCLRPEDTIARLGGDEFTVLLEDITDVRYAIGVAERIAEALKDPLRLDDHEASVTASIGIAVGTGREANPDELVRKADMAMYEAKKHGKARFVVFNEELEPEAAAEEAADGARSFDTEPAPEAVEIEIHREETSEPLPEPELEAEPDAEIARAHEAEAEAAPELAQEPEAAEEPRADGHGPPPEAPAESSLSEARRRRRMRLRPR